MVPNDHPARSPAEIVAPIQSLSLEESPDASGRAKNIDRNPKTLSPSKAPNAYQRREVQVQVAQLHCCFQDRNHNPIYKRCRGPESLSRSQS